VDNGGEQARAEELIRAIYARHPAGCCMHIVLDDLNVEDRHVHFCHGFACARDCDECMGLSRLMLMMTEGERRALLQ
jgi:hypothetical protein